MTIQIAPLFWIIFLAITSIPQSVQTQSFPCSKRHRRSWFALSDEEQLLYISGFQKLRKNGKLNMITTTYSQLTAVRRLQHSSSFLFMHEYLTYEIESAIRALGGDYACFAMPFYDFTADAGSEHNAMIFETAVGEKGDEQNGYCVRSEYWSVCTDDDDDALCYWTPFEADCAPSETEHDAHCCLKRAISATQVLPSSAEIAFAIQHNTDFRDFSLQLKTFMDSVYIFVGGNIETAPMVNGMATEDPLFFLIASFVGYMRAMWSDCHDYDSIDSQDLEQYRKAFAPFAMYAQSGNENENAYGLDSVFFNDDDDDDSDAVPLTVRRLYDLSQLNVVYDVGTFWMTSKMNEWCSAQLNEAWFDLQNSDGWSEHEQAALRNPVNVYIETTWNALTERSIPAMDGYDKFAAVSALSCDFVRRHSLSSCFSDDMPLSSELQSDACSEMEEADLETLTLDDVNAFVEDGNECLLRIRQETWSYVQSDAILKRSVCLGQFDYQCNVWPSDGYEDLSGIIENESAETDHIVPSPNMSFTTFDTSIWSVLLWCSMFIFTFIMCCYMFIVKKDFEIEVMHKKSRRVAHVQIYGAISAVTDL